MNSWVPAMVRCMASVCKTNTKENILLRSVTSYSTYSAFVLHMYVGCLSIISKWSSSSSYLRKSFLSLKIFDRWSLFFFIFIAHFTWACRGLRLIHCSILYLAATFVCLTTYSFLYWFQPNLYHCLYCVCSTSHC